MQLISVTQALSPYYKQAEKINPVVLENAAARGTLVHQACALIAQDMPIIFDIPPECQGYVESFKRWFDGHVKEVILVEQELVDTDFGFMGHPDIIVELGEGYHALVDLKTPAGAIKLWKAQISAYMYLANKHKHNVTKAGSLRLSSEGGTPRMDWNGSDNNKYFTIFLSALNSYRNLML